MVVEVSSPSSDPFMTIAEQLATTSAMIARQPHPPAMNHLPRFFCGAGAGAPAGMPNWGAEEGPGAPGSGDGGRVLFTAGVLSGQDSEAPGRGGAEGYCWEERPAAVCGCSVTECVDRPRGACNLNLAPAV